MTIYIDMVTVGQLGLIGLGVIALGLIMFGAGWLYDEITGFNYCYEYEDEIEE